MSLLPARKIHWSTSRRSCATATGSKILGVAPSVTGSEGQSLAWPEFIDNLRESAQLLGLVIGVPAAIVGLFKALYEIRANREQRSTELRWKRANLAKELLDDIHRHDQARNAVHMLDWRHAQIVYELTAGHTETISYSDVLAALKKNQAEAQGQKDI